MLLSDIQFASAAAIILSGQAVKAEATSPCFTTLAVKCFLAPLELIFHSRTTRISPIFVFGCQSVDLCELRFTFFFLLLLLLLLFLAQPEGTDWCERFSSCCKMGGCILQEVGGKKQDWDWRVLLIYCHGVWVDPVGLRVLKLAPAYRAPCKPSVQVKTWTSAALQGERFSLSLSFFFLLTAAIQRHWSNVEIFTAAYLVSSKAISHMLHFLLYLLSFWKCDSLVACFFLTFPPPLSLSASLSLSLCRWVSLSSLALCPSLWSHMWKWSA